MASTGETTPLTCSICLEYKDQKSPRILPCHHSFCEECLQSWHSKRLVQHLDRISVTECPICRKKVTLSDGGIKELPMDFRVQEVSSFLHLKSDKKACEVCNLEGNIKPAEACCKTCNMRFCLDCSEAHTKMSLFSNHEVIRAFCDIHGSALDYVCVTCCSGLCVTCVYSRMHTNHEIQNAEAGITSVQAKLVNIKSELNDSIAACDEEIRSKLQVCFDKQCKSEEKMRSAGDRIKKAVDRVIEVAIQEHKTQHKAAVDQAFEKFKEDNMHNAVVMGEITKLFEKERSDILMSMRKVFISAEASVNSETATHLSLPEPALLSTECCRLDGIDKAIDAVNGCILVCGVSSALLKSHEKPDIVLLKKVECDETNGLDSPWNLNITCDGDAVVCHFNGGAAHRVRKDGTVEAITGTKSVTAASVNENNMYFVRKEGDVLMKLQEGSAPYSVDLDLAVPNSRGLALCHGNAFTCSDGNIVKHSLTDSCGTVLLDGKFWGSMICTRVGGSAVLAVTESESHEVIMMDETGRVLRRFGQKRNGNGELNDPRGIDRLANGNFLVADWDNSRIVEYTAGGTFVRNVLTEADGLSFPSDVANLYPFLWVTESVRFTESGKKHKSIKLFMYCN